MKNHHNTKSFLCKKIAKFLAAGLACAAVLIGSPSPTAPDNGNISNGNLSQWEPFPMGTFPNGNLSHGSTGNAESGLIFENYSENGTDDGQEIAPQSNDQSWIEMIG